MSFFQNTISSVVSRCLWSQSVSKSIGV